MNFKKRTQFLITCGTILGCSAPSVSLADTLSISPFALYEQADNQIVVDGVSSQYALGVAGVAFNFNATSYVELTAAAGYGFTSNQKVSFAGANLIGDVSGKYTGLGVKIKIYENSRGQKIKLEYKMHNRDLSAPTLTGNRNGSPLTGNSDIQYNSNDFGISAAHPFTKNISANLALGVSEWDFAANGTAFTNNNITARKNIAASGSDPYWSVGLDIKLDKLDGKIEVGQRNLSSQSEAKITHITIGANYSF